MIATTLGRAVRAIGTVTAAFTLPTTPVELSASERNASAPAPERPAFTTAPFAEETPYRSDEFGRRAWISARAPRAAFAGTAPGASGAALDWEFAGPFGGTVACLAVSPVNPELILAGMEVNFTFGLYLSEDGGRTWTVEMLEPSPFGSYDYAGGVNDIEFAPDGTAYAAADYGAYRRAPGEAAWTSLPVGNYYLFHEVCVHPTNPSELWLGLDRWVGPGSPVGILRSRDGGVTWENVTPPFPNSTTACTGIAFDPNDPDIVVVCFGYYYKGGALWRSTDGGDSWLTPENAFVNPLTEVVHDGSRFLVSGGDVYAGQSVGVYSSTDDGASWSPVHGAGWPSRVVRDLELDPRAPGTIFAATSRGVFQSTDAGATWTFGVGASGDLSVNAVRVDPRDPSGMILGTESKGVWRRGNGDATVRESSTGIRALYLEDVAVNPANPLELAVSFQGQNTGGVFSSVDGGRAWKLEPVPAVRFGSLEFAADGVLYAASEGPAEPGAPEGLYRREPDGRWTSLGPNPGPYYEADVWHFRASTTNPDLLVLGGVDWRTNRPTIWRSTDRGAVWTRVFSGAGRPTGGTWVSTVEILEDGTDQTMVASHTGVGAVVTSTSGGETWANVSSGIPDTILGWSLCASPVDPRMFFLATSGSCYGSTDAGATWTQGGSSQNLRALLCDPADADVVYGTGSWIVRSEDGGATFASFDAGLDVGALGSRFALRGGPRPALLVATSRGLYFRTLDEPVPGAALRQGASVAGVGPAAPGVLAGGLVVAGSNPFRDGTALGFALGMPQRVTLDVYDVRGVHLRSLLSGALPAGAHRATWDGTDASGRRVVSGIYFVRLATGESRHDAKVVLVR